MAGPGVLFWERNEESMMRRFDFGFTLFIEEGRALSGRVRDW